MVQKASAQGIIRLNKKAERMNSQNLRLTEEIQALNEKLTAARDERDQAVQDWQELLKKDASDHNKEIERIKEVHSADISALKLRYQQLSKKNQEDVTQRDARITKLETKLTSIKKSLDEAIDEDEELTSSLDKSRETCQRLAGFCAEYEKKRELEEAEAFELATASDKSPPVDSLEGIVTKKG